MRSLLLIPVFAACLGGPPEVVLSCEETDWGIYADGTCYEACAGNGFAFGTCDERSECVTIAAGEVARIVSWARREPEEADFSVWPIECEE
jgi:hypothetical protein